MLEHVVGPRVELRNMLRSAVQYGEFTLASGATSTYYLDARLVTLSSRGILLVGELMGTSLVDDIQLVGGPATGAIPIAIAVAVATGLDTFFLRSQSKDHGRRLLIEGVIPPGSRVALVDDVLTTGRSLLDSAQALEATGHQVVQILVLVDRDAGGKATLTKYRVDVLFGIQELLAEEKESC